jgi:hypothetical protein
MQNRLGWLLISASIAACGDAAPERARGDEPKPRPVTAELAWRPVPAGEHYAGKSLEEWAVEWRRWAFSQTSCDSTAFDPDGSLCDLYQDPESPVFFLDFAAARTVREQCRVPPGKALAVPLVVFASDNLFVDPPRTLEQIEQRAARALDSMRALLLEADGEEIENLEDWQVAPTRFTYDIPSAPNWFSCNKVDGIADTTIDPAYLSGYLVVFPPPEPGRHVLRYGGVLTTERDDYAFDVTTKFVVETEDDG